MLKNADYTVSMSSNFNDDISNEPPVSQPQAETEGPGGGKRVRTALGLGDGDDGGWYNPSDMPEFSDEPIRHEILKDIAIDALAGCESRDRQNVSNQLLLKIKYQYPFVADGLSDVLAGLVVSAYVVAQYVPSKQVFKELRASPLMLGRVYAAEICPADD